MGLLDKIMIERLVMFENISQGLVTIGAAAYLAVPFLRLLAAIFMACSTYKLLKARRDRHKLIWILAILLFPVLARIVYEIFCRCIVKKDIRKVKGSIPLLLLSVITFAISGVLMMASIISMGVGYLKSEIDGEPIDVFYDVQGNKYYDIYEVPLHDKEGNTYTYEAAWFSAGTYTDQNGKKYDGDYCYLSQEGYFYYDSNDALKPYEDSSCYYTDGRTIFYGLLSHVYWAEDGTIWEFSGKRHLKLFDID